jgi:peroxiredoxin Q/BCP
MPTVGNKAPWPAGITTQSGKPVSLTEHTGKHVLVYFYPKDDTPGCTIEACNFRDHRTDIDAVIYGVSLDDAASHKAFIDKFKLPFDLLVDRDKALAKAYDVDPNNSGYASRSSFLVGPDGNLKAVWPKVKPDQHWVEVKDAIKK